MSGTDTRVKEWTIRWAGHEWTPNDLTGQHLAALAIISGDDSFGSLELTPDTMIGYPAQGYMRLMFMLSALAGVTACEGLEGDEAAGMMGRVLASIQAATAEDILASITFD